MNFRSLAMVGAALSLAACAVASEPEATTATAHSELSVAQMCGGFAGIACPKGQDCVDDPSDGCDPTRGGRDCAGICVTPSSARTAASGEVCGGFLGLGCPKGETCVDNPNDDCDPRQGGADCDGICQ